MARSSSASTTIRVDERSREPAWDDEISESVKQRAAPPIGAAVYCAGDPIAIIPPTRTRGLPVRIPRTDADDARHAWEATKNASPDRKTFTCQTITPLYGGGVSAGEVDRELPIRASGLRGQFRSWWRLLNRGRFPSSGELFAAEKALWGGIGGAGPTASRVRVAVTCDGSAKPTKWSGIDGVPAYALVLEPGTDPDLLPAGCRFTLQIDCPDAHWPEVEPALRWWASFGGLGARTRRGLGAVRVEGLAPVTEEQALQAGGHLKLGGRVDNAAQAWRTAVNRLRDFRQGAGVGRNPGQGTKPNHPGRSRWPEADAIRRLSGNKSPVHPPEHPVDRLYPRAAFGLPIVFHFKDKGAGDPKDHVLEPSGERFDRMASPLILRPYWDGEAYAPAALLIPGWERALERGLKFKSIDRNLTVWPSDPRARADAASRIRPMAGRGDDPLTAFLDFFVNGGK